MAKVGPKKQISFPHMCGPPSSCYKKAKNVHVTAGKLKEETGSSVEDLDDVEDRLATNGATSLLFLKQLRATRTSRKVAALVEDDISLLA